MNPLMNLTDLLMERLADRECSRCGRRLKDPDSIERGMGPICAQHRYGATFGVIHFGHHPDRVDWNKAFKKFFTEFPDADFVVVGQHYQYSAYANVKGYPLVFVGGEQDEPDEYDTQQMEWRQNLVNSGLELECIHADASWLEYIGSDWGYLGPTTLNYEDWCSQEGWSPGLCICMSDQFNEDEYELELEYDDTIIPQAAEKGELCRILAEAEKLKVVAEQEQAYWDPSYWEDFYDFMGNNNVSIADSDLQPDTSWSWALGSMRHL